MSNAVASAAGVPAKAKGAIKPSIHNQALDKLERLKKGGEKVKAAMQTTVKAGIHTAETQGAVFTLSMVEGYFGSEKMAPGGYIDVRAPAAVLALGFGLWESMSGQGDGGHALAIGNGIAASYLASMGVAAGKALAEKRAHDANPAGNSPVAPVVKGIEGERRIYDQENREPMSARVTPGRRSRRFVQAS